MNEAAKSRRTEEASPSNLVKILSQKVVGQSEAMRCIVPYVQMYQAGLAFANRPAGVFLLLGPTGTGKTRTVEALAEVLHGSPKNILKINCGEYQLDHHTARLIGAPPGYLGYGQAEPALSQQKLEAATSPNCDLAVVLFDEVEKASPAVTQLLLGVLDKATLSLADGSDVNFEDTLIFFTSNLGAREMMREIHPGLGFRQNARRPLEELVTRLERVSLAAVRRKYSAEFINRIDAVITYQPLDAESLASILDLQILELQQHVDNRLGNKGFLIEVPEESRQFLLRKGASEIYGARELKRVIHRYLTQPLATMVAEGRVPAGSKVISRLNGSGDALVFTILQSNLKPESEGVTILIVDDNTQLLHLLCEYFRKNTQARIVTAGSISAASKILPEADVALLDVVLPDGDGISLGVRLKATNPYAQILIMTGAELPAEDRAVCEEYRFDFLPKPFLMDQALRIVQEGMVRQTKAVR